MSKEKFEKGGLVSVVLKTGLIRGNVKAVAGETVGLGPGLANRLVDRNMASFTKDEVKRRAAKAKKASAAAKATEGNKTPPAKPEVKGDPKPPEVGTAKPAAPPAPDVSPAAPSTPES